MRRGHHGRWRRTTGGGGGTTGGGGGTTGGGGGTTGGGTGGGAACTAFDFSQAQSVYAEFTAATMNGDANHFGVVATQSATASKVDFVFFEGWYFDANQNPTFPKTVMLPSPADATYWQCYD